MDSKKIMNAVPKEAILSGLVESGTLNVLIAPAPGEPAFFRTCVRALALYMNNVNRNLRGALLEDGTPEEKDRRKTDIFLKGYGLREFITRLDSSEEETVLSWLLGADVILLSEKAQEKEEYLGLAETFSLPVICIGGAETFCVTDGVLHAGDTAADAAAALSVVKSRHYTALLKQKEGSAVKKEASKCVS